MIVEKRRERLVNNSQKLLRKRRTELKSNVASSVQAAHPQPPPPQVLNYGNGLTEETTSHNTTSNTIVRLNGEIIATIDKAQGNNIKMQVRMGCGAMRQQIALSIGANLGPHGLTITSLGGGNYSGTTLPPHHEATISRGGITTNGLPYMNNGCLIISNSSIVMSGGRW